MKRCLAAILIVLTVLTGGCWDQKEINDLAIAVAVASDLENINGHDMVRFTLQIANPSALVPGGGGGQGAPKAFWTVAGVGKTIRLAQTEVFNRMPKRMFLGQNRVYIIGEKAARNGIVPLLDRPLRSRDQRESLYIVIARGEAKKVLELEMPTFRATGLAINGMLQNDSNYNHLMGVTLTDFAYRLSTATSSPIAPVVEVVPQSSVSVEDKKTGESAPQTIKLSDLAVFSTDGKLLGFLNDKETDGLLWVLNKSFNREIAVTCPQAGPDQPVVLTVKRSQCSIETRIDKTGQPDFIINVRTICDISEHYGNHLDLLDTAYFETLERRANTVIEGEIRTALLRSQTLNADIFELGEEVRRQHHEVWLRILPAWKDLYPRVKVTIKCETGIRHRGLYIKPPTSRKEGI